jgi:hypothetical protein
MRYLYKYLKKTKGYRYRRVRRCPKLTLDQKAERLEWCQRNRDNEFEYFVFIDESKLMNNNCKLYHIRKKATLPECIIINHVTVKLNIWGGISKRGATEFVVSLKQPLNMSLY